MEIGVFIPIGDNGWPISMTAPRFRPSFDDFLAGMDQFGQRIQPMMRSRAAVEGQPR